MIVGNPILNLFLLLIIAYLLGSLPSAFIAGKLKNIDIRNAGSKNVGGMNTISSVGKLAGLLVLIADFGKGALAAFIANYFSDHPFIPLLAIVVAMIGHNWVIWLGFKGGKGVSVFLGGILYIAPLSFVFLCIIILPLFLILLKDTYLAQGTALLAFGFFLWGWYGSYLFVFFAFWPLWYIVLRAGV